MAKLPTAKSVRTTKETLMKANMPFLRTPYNYDRDEASNESGLACKDESKTIQSQANDTDINVIMRKYAQTGLLPNVTNPPTYGDFEGVEDYQSALHVVMEAQKAFNQLDADVRRKFNYDPGEFVEFAENPANVEEMRKWGLALPKTQPEPQGDDKGTPPSTPPKGGG
jgi:phage internal scaffolding protein